MRSITPTRGTKWLILGDFNLIYKATDKNNSNLNRQLMAQFREALSDCELQEIHLQNRKFTWSNEQQNPTLVKLDRLFGNAEWDACFGTHVLHALSTTHSDHCPLLLTDQNGPRRPRTFKFENYWPKMPRFIETVQSVWNAPTDHHEPFHRLYHKLTFPPALPQPWYG